MIKLQLQSKTSKSKQYFSPLLFAAVMDVVCSEARSGLLSELLYANDLVIMAPTMEQLGRRVAEWRVTLLDKGLNVNAGKWPSGVCGKGVQVNFVQCTVCKNGFTSGAVVCVVTCRR